MKQSEINSINILRNVSGDDTADLLEKAVNHKYFKREGAPGNYKYYYTEAEYKQARGKGEEIDSKKGGDLDNFLTKMKKNIVDSHDNSPWEFPGDIKSATEKFANQHGLSIADVNKLTEQGVLVMSQENKGDVKGGIFTRVKFNVNKLKSETEETKGNKKAYEITAPMVEYLDKYKEEDIIELIDDYSREVGITFSKEEKTDLIKQYNEIKGEGNGFGFNTKVLKGTFMNYKDTISVEKIDKILNLLSDKGIKRDQFKVPFTGIDDKERTLEAEKTILSVLDLNKLPDYIYDFDVRKVIRTAIEYRSSLSK